MEIREEKGAEYLLQVLKRALQCIRAGQWSAAHDLVQQHEGDPTFDHLHAILHRMEGDAFNAGWWYSRLGKKMPRMTIEEELSFFEKKFFHGEV